MKRAFLTICITCVVLLGFAQNMADKAFYVYRNDNVINTFLFAEVDSITYSFLDADSLWHEDVVTQIIFTQDSVYFMPISLVDSISFIVPETKFQTGVIILENDILDNVLSFDSLTIFFKPNIPASLLPRVEDKLITMQPNEKFQSGFMGQVKSITNLVDSIAVECEVVGYEDVFETLYFVHANTLTDPAQQMPMRRYDDGNWYSDGGTTFGPFKVPLNSLYAGISEVEAQKNAFSVTNEAYATITPTFWIKSALIINKLAGVSLTVDIHSQVVVSETINLNGALEGSKEIPTPTGKYSLVLPGITNLYYYGGIVFKAKADIALKNHWQQIMESDYHFEMSYYPWIPVPTIITKALMSNTHVKSTEHQTQGMINGTVSVGPFAELGLELVDRHLAKAGFRLEGGIQVVGTFQLKKSDSQDALKSTALYNILKNTSVKLNAFVKTSAELNWLDKKKLSATIDPVSKTWELVKKQLVPTFSDMSFYRDNYNVQKLIAKSSVSGDLLTTADIYIRLYDGETKEDISQNFIGTIKGTSLTINTEFNETNPMKSYLLYPSVRIYGIEMLATPYATLSSAGLVGKWKITIDGRDDYFDLFDGGHGSQWSGANCDGVGVYDDVRWTLNGNNVHLDLDQTVHFVAGEEELGCITFTNFYQLNGILQEDGSIVGTGIGHTCVGWNEGLGTWCNEKEVDFTMTRSF